MTIVDDGLNQLSNSTVKAVLTDVHFWIPAIVLLFGFVLLFLIR